MIVASTIVPRLSLMPTLDEVHVHFAQDLQAEIMPLKQMPKFRNRHKPVV